jgi:hypothetical protein
MKIASVMRKQTISAGIMTAATMRCEDNFYLFIAVFMCCIAGAYYLMRKNEDRKMRIKFITLQTLKISQQPIECTIMKSYIIELNPYTCRCLFRRYAGEITEQ